MSHNGNHVETPRMDGTPHKPDLRQALQQIQAALTGLQYGQVTISVQDGVVMQIDRLERTRLRLTPR